jgi:argininosuccinate lyase
MRHSAEIGFGSATELADVIVRETGLSFRMAHNIVATAVRETLEADKTALDIRAQDLFRIGRDLFGRDLELGEEVVKQALDPSHNIEIRTIVGGPAPANVQAMVAERQKRLATDAAAVETAIRRIDAARARTFAAAAGQRAA